MLSLEKADALIVCDAFFLRGRVHPQCKIGDLNVLVLADGLCDFCKSGLAF